MTYYSRRDWKARPPRARYKLREGDVDGIALHWPAISSPLGNPDRVMSALRAWQNDHMDNPAKRWSDIAYQVAIDQEGNTYRLRGLRHRSAANGGTDVNLRFGAILLVVAGGEHPTMPLIEATRKRIAVFRRYFPDANRIVGHRDIRPPEVGATACPGDRIHRLILAGAFDPNQR